MYFCLCAACRTNSLGVISTNDLNTFKDEIEIMGDIVEEIENKQEFGENKDKGKKGEIVDLEQFRKK